MDLSIYETGDGGDVKLINEYDLAIVDGIENQPYLAHFAGNIEQNTTENIEPNQERFDWWGNSFEDESMQFNSNLERALIDNALTTAGRSVIENEAKSDFEYLSDIAEIDTTVIITGKGKIKINDKVNELRNSFTFDGAIIEQKI